MVQLFVGGTAGPPTTLVSLLGLDRRKTEISFRPFSKTR
jgi:hypothetical protein